MKFLLVSFAVVSITIACAPNKPKAPKPKPAPEPEPKCAKVVYAEALCKKHCLMGSTRCICGAPDITTTEVTCPSCYHQLETVVNGYAADIIADRIMKCNEKTGQWEFNAVDNKKDAYISKPFSVVCTIVFENNKL